NVIADAAARGMRHNLERHGVAYYRGRGCFEDRNTLVVESEKGAAKLSTDFILIATGSRPFQPPDIDFPDTHIWDSDEILQIDRLPASLAILGGGVIGCEYACMFAALGVEITLVDARLEILPFLDAEIIARLREAMQNLGIRLVQGQRWTTVKRQGDGVVT